MKQKKKARYRFRWNCSRCPWTAVYSYRELVPMIAYQCPQCGSLTAKASPIGQQLPLVFEEVKFEESL